jgi:hypothetical protein
MDGVQEGNDIERGLCGVVIFRRGFDTDPGTDINDSFIEWLKKHQPSAPTGFFVEMRGRVAAELKASGYAVMPHAIPFLTSIGIHFDRRRHTDFIIAFQGAIIRVDVTERAEKLSDDYVPRPDIFLLPARMSANGEVIVEEEDKQKLTAAIAEEILRVMRERGVLRSSRA